MFTAPGFPGPNISVSLSLCVYFWIMSAVPSHKMVRLWGHSHQSLSSFRLLPTLVLLLYYFFSYFFFSPFFLFSCFFSLLSCQIAMMTSQIVGSTSEHGTGLGRAALIAASRASLSAHSFPDTPTCHGTQQNSI